MDSQSSSAGNQYPADVDVDADVDDTVHLLVAPEPLEPGATELEKGTTVGRYVILSLLGRGGMGTVHAAYDPDLDRKVAIKVLRDDRSPNDHTSASSRRTRLLREAQALAKLSHPNVVQVHDVGTFDDRVFIATELVDGESLAEHLSARRRPWPEILDLFIRAGRGLAAAHVCGLVHRDFKPQNVMVDRGGSVRVMDFGLVRYTSSEDVDPRGLEYTPDDSSTGPPTGPALTEELTEAGTVMGTPAYMAPEQYAGGTADLRTDVYAFCTALYEALYGQRPFHPASRRSLLEAKLVGKPSPLVHERRVPRAIRRALIRGIAPDPEDRWSSMEELLSALHRGSRGPSRRRAALIGLLGVSLVATIGHGQVADQSSVCSGAEERLVGVWDAATKDEIRQAFLATGLPYAESTWSSVQRSVDAYTHDWAAMHRNACEATHLRNEYSTDVLDLRMSCLDKRLWNLRALTDLMSDADATLVENAVKATGGLLPVEECNAADTLAREVPMPEDPKTRQAVERIQGEMAKASALFLSGRAKEASAMAGELTTRARMLKHEPTLAEVLVDYGKFLEKAGRFEDAVPPFTEAAALGLATGLDTVAARAQAGLVLVLGIRLGRVVEASVWKKQLDAMLKRVDGDERVTATALGVIGGFLTTQGNTSEAVDYMREAVAATRRVHGDEHPQTVTAWSNVGYALLHANEIEDAIAAFEQALRLADRIYGGQHSWQCLPRNNLASAYADSGRWAQAEATIEQVLTDCPPLIGEDALVVSWAKVNLFKVRMHQGDFSDADRLLTRATKAIEEHSGAESPDMAGLLAMRASWHVEQKQWRQALDVRRSQLGLADRLGMKGIPRIEVLNGMALAHVELGNLPAARDVLERALEAGTSVPDSPQVAETKSRLAPILWRVGEHERAQELATQAQSALASPPTPHYEKIRDDLEQWLATIGVPASAIP